MPRLSANLLPTTSAELDHTPKDVIGEKVKGDGYYGFSDGLHTIAHYISDFVGKLEVQGTLAETPTDADWVTISTVEEVNIPTPLSENISYNFTGNYVWVRAKITGITYGTIAKLQINH